MCYECYAPLVKYTLEENCFLDWGSGAVTGLVVSHTDHDHQYYSNKIGPFLGPVSKSNAVLY